MRLLISDLSNKKAFFSALIFRFLRASQSPHFLIRLIKKL